MVDHIGRDGCARVAWGSTLIQGQARGRPLDWDACDNVDNPSVRATDRV